MNLKKMIIPLILSILFGYFCGNFVFKIYKEKTDAILDSTKVYLLQTGAYTTLDSMKKNTTLKNYIYYQDDGLYKTIMAITKDKDNINKIKKIYNEDIIINEYYLDNPTINSQIKKYDIELKNTSDNSKIQEILDEMLNSNNVILVASYGCCGTGLTFKNVDYCIFAQSFKSDIINLQSIGRMLLKTEEKSKAYSFGASGIVIF